MKRALIVGISGQDGAYLTRLLLEKGIDVSGTSRQSGDLSNLRTLGIEGIACHVVDPCNPKAVADVLEKVDPHEIYNLSGQSSVGLSFEKPLETFESIAVANLNLLESLRQRGKPCRYICAGSSECFGNTPEPATEETPFEPRNPYATAKAAAFWQVVNYREAYGLHCSTGILYNHESPLRPERFVTRKIVRTACRIAAGSDELLHLGNIDICRDWGWAPDYVDALWRMAQLDAPHDFLIATGITCHLRDFVAAVFAAVGLDWEHHVTSDASLLRATDIPVSRANPEKAARLLNWKATYDFHEVARLLVHAEQNQKESLLELRF